jgi:kynureninase
MSLTVADLARSPNALAPHYSRFRVAEQLLMTGHSHQAWPDVGFEAHQRAWTDAATHADDKWDAAFEEAEGVRRGYAELLEDTTGDVTLGSNTHELLVRFLSALPLASRPRIVTTDAEFHSARRQLDRLAETGTVEVVKVPGYPASHAAERLAAAVDDATACVIVSAVFFERGHIVPGLAELMDVCRARGAELLVDSYHALGAMPFGLAEHGLEEAFVVGGGYKYLQMGEGNCFLRVPPGCEMRPVITGWFTEFGELADEKTPGEVRYGRGAARFAGSTYDPTSHYRGAAVMDFFRERGLTSDFLREVSLHQVELLETTFRDLDLDPEVARLDSTVSAAGRGGFLALECADARGLSQALREHGVRTDFRGCWLRFGPAPYHTDDQVRRAMEALGAVARSGA